MWFIGNSNRCKNHFKLWRFIAIFYFLLFQMPENLKNTALNNRKVLGDSNIPVS